MFKQIRDIDQEKQPNSNVYIITAHENQLLYVSRSYAGHRIEQYTSTSIEHAIIYFTRQAAEMAIKTDFKFSRLSMKVSRVPINSDDKERLKLEDADLRNAKKLARRKREKQYEKQSED